MRTAVWLAMSDTNRSERKANSSPAKVSDGRNYGYRSKHSREFKGIFFPLHMPVRDSSPQPRSRSHGVMVARRDVDKVP
jgi:hypothetical protein